MYSMNKLLDAKTETEVVAYMARGDDYNTILATLAGRGIELSKPNLTQIKQRNSEALAYMQNAMVESQLSHASAILRKSRQLLERKLDQTLKIDEQLIELKKLFDNSDMDVKEYLYERDKILRTELTAGELTAITKESFNQSQVEQGKPSSITENPAQAKANLEKVLRAIAEGDDKAAIEALFLDAES